MMITIRILICTLAGLQWWSIVHLVSDPGIGFLLILQSLLSHFKASWHNDDDDNDNDLYREDTFDETNDDFDYNCLYKIKNELILYLMMST